MFCSLEASQVVQPSLKEMSLKGVNTKMQGSLAILETKTQKNC